MLGREWKALCGNVALCLVIQEEGVEAGYIEKTQKYESIYRKANVKSPSEVVQWAITDRLNAGYIYAV